jgi:uncharacterized protein YbjT (DUF2867 family)
VDVLVTGATGSAGSQLVPELLERGHRVRAPSRLLAAVDGHQGDAVSGRAEALDGCRVAYTSSIRWTPRETSRPAVP